MPDDRNREPRWRMGETGPRWAGMPLSWFSRPGGGHVDLRGVRHPMKWLRWRIQLRRLGPYAPDFDPTRGAATGPPTDR